MNKTSLIGIVGLVLGLVLVEYPAAAAQNERIVGNSRKDMAREVIRSLGQPGKYHRPSNVVRYKRWVTDKRKVIIALTIRDPKTNLLTRRTFKVSERVDPFHPQADKRLQQIERIVETKDGLEYAVGSGRARRVLSATITEDLMKVPDAEYDHEVKNTVRNYEATVQFERGWSLRKSKWALPRVAQVSFKRESKDPHDNKQAKVRVGLSGGTAVFERNHSGSDDKKTNQFDHLLTIFEYAERDFDNLTPASDGKFERFLATLQLIDEEIAKLPEPKPGLFKTQMKRLSRRIGQFELQSPITVRFRSPITRKAEKTED